MHHHNLSLADNLCGGDNRTVANASTWIHTEITQLLVDSFVVKDHLRDGVLFLVDVDQALTTDKGVSMQRAWHGTCTLTEDVPSYLVQN